MTAFVIPNALQLTTRQNKYSFTSFLARDTTYDVIHNIWRLARPDVSSAGGGSTRASLEDVGGRPASERVRSASSNVAAPGSQKVTHCACGKNGEHYSEVASDTILPGTPEKVYTLMFASAFMKEFMREDQKLIDLQISDWEPASSDPKFLSRNMSYIKPLSGSLGPKQTKCELRDETVHFDFDDYVSTVTTTRTPDVPSGGVFAVKTRTCLTWAGNFATRVVVTTTVEWTGRSFIKSIIERSAIEGQKTYHADLEKHLKQYIAAHRSEFIPEGADESVLEPAAVAETAAPGTPSAGEALSPEDVRRKREQERSQRGLQWALDTFMGAYKVGKQSASGAIELLMDFWDNSSGTHILWILVFALLLSNVWTFLKMGKREEVGRRKAETRKLAEREQWIGDTVRILLQELRETPGSLPHVASSPTDSASSRKAEIAELLQSLDAIETRVARLKGTLDSLD
ncbi:hypothetical protein SISSUDRAFT_979744 [Sistotremastrum suecicum HHB10207 ss-3]|nr:hypothetical protein SISSUDRAFT_979744 [Sistotremastrum suecicum HHB10207 ss-3]